MYLNFALFVIPAWLCLYYVVRSCQIDPHNVEATPRPWVCILRSGLVLLAVLIALGARTVQPDWVPFLCMFALSQTIAAPFASPFKMREDEEPSWLIRFIEGAKFQAAGSFAVKIISIVLGFLLGRLIGNWWFGIIIIAGAVLLRSKNVTALLLIDDADGEFRRLSQDGRFDQMKKWARISRRGNWAYLVWGCSFGYFLFELGGLQPGNWFGWSGLIGGVLFGAVWDAIPLTANFRGK